MSRTILFTLCFLMLVFLPVQASMALSPQYQWQPVAGEDAEFALLLSGKQVGGYSFSRGLFRPLLPSGEWGEPCEPPCELPADPRPVAPQSPTYIGDLPTGVNWDRLNRDTQPHYYLNGKEVPRDRVLEILRKKPLKGIGDKQVPDDSKKPWCVAIARSKTDRDRLSKDWDSAPELTPWKSKFRFQCYDPADPLTGWPAADFKVPENVPLTIRLLKADGTELHRQDDYSSPADLAKALEVAARKADPSYQPDKTPDLRKPQIPGLDVLQKLPWSVWALASAALVFLLLGRNKLYAG